MSNDYSTPTPIESGAVEAAPPPISGETTTWVKGNLPTPAASAEAPASEPAPEEKKLARKKRKEKETRRDLPGLRDPAGLRPARPVAEAMPGDLSLEALVESLLFVADGPTPVAQLAEALEVTPRAVETALNALSETYASGQRGLSLQRSRDKVQLTTASAAGAKVERFLGLAAAQPLSRAALEALAIIAYQQPVTRPQIEAVRGVNSDSVLKNLLSKGLIEEVGRTEGPGRPVLYATTPEFLQYFGLASLASLPALNLETPVFPQPQAESQAQPAPEQPQEFLRG